MREDGQRILFDLAGVPFLRWNVKGTGGSGSSPTCPAKSELGSFELIGMIQNPMPQVVSHSFISSQRVRRNGSPRGLGACNSMDETALSEPT